MRLICLFTLFVLVGSAVMVAAPDSEEAPASGQKWLGLLDDQKYEDSWKQSAAMFHDQVTESQWITSLKQFREPLGGVVSRKVSRLDFAKTLRGAPDGDYAIIHFKTDFQNKSDVTERLTLVKEEGKWQMAAYAIH